MRDALAALLRLRGWTHDDERDPYDRHWLHYEVGVRPMMVALASEIRYCPEGTSAAYWDTYTVQIAVPEGLSDEATIRTGGAENAGRSPV